MKLIYKPNTKSPAGEYAKYSVSIFEGCREKACSYCYMAKMNKRFNKYFGEARIKVSLQNKDIVNLFNKELEIKLPEYQKHGLFFFFNSDPFLPQTKELTEKLIYNCWLRGIRATTLTKEFDWINTFDFKLYTKDKNINFGFTLTGMDELESACPSTKARIEAMQFIHEKGFDTWVSLEPCVDLGRAFLVFLQAMPYTNQFKIGLLSGKKYEKEEVIKFVNAINMNNIHAREIVFKQSIKKYL